MMKKEMKIFALGVYGDTCRHQFIWVSVLLLSTCRFFSMFSRNLIIAGTHLYIQNQFVIEDRLHPQELIYI